GLRDLRAGDPRESAQVHRHWLHRAPRDPRVLGWRLIEGLPRTVAMRFDDLTKASVKPTMAHFFYMDENDPTKVIRWMVRVGPAGFCTSSRCLNSPPSPNS